MERAREVAQYWSWLPAFRAVAETEHLPTAAKALCLSPSAVSRTIKLLEEELGHTLFDRSQGRLELNERGDVLLACVRASMRLVHEGTEVMRDAQLRGALRVSAPAGLANLFLLPAVPALLARHPHLEPEIESENVATLAEALQRGGLDIALVENPAPNSTLRMRPLVRLEHDVFVRPEMRVTDLDVLRFVVPLETDLKVSSDAWPQSRPRQIALRVSCATMAIDAVRRGLDAVVLPVCVGVDSGLKRLHTSGLRTSDLMVLSRSSLPGLSTRAEIVADAISAYVEEHACHLDGVTLQRWTAATIVSEDAKVA